MSESLEKQLEAQEPGNSPPWKKSRQESTIHCPGRLPPRAQRVLLSAPLPWRSSTTRPNTGLEFLSKALRRSTNALEDLGLRKRSPFDGQELKTRQARRESPLSRPKPPILPSWARPPGPSTGLRAENLSEYRALFRDSGSPQSSLRPAGREPPGHGGK
jgi:hypothetical protein